MAQVFAEANEETVRAGLEHMRRAFEEFVNSYPGTVDHMDGFMIAHNLHVLVILDIETRMEATPAAQLMLRKMAVETLEDSLERRP